MKCVCTGDGGRQCFGVVGVVVGDRTTTVRSRAAGHTRAECARY